MSGHHDQVKFAGLRGLRDHTSSIASQEDPRTAITLVRIRSQEREWKQFQELILASRQKFIRMAYTILRNTEDAEDAVQDALLSAYLHLHAFEGRSALTTWFGRIVLNAAFMIRRKRKPSQIDCYPESSNTEEIPWIEKIATREPDPEMFCAERETFELINALLGKMTPMLRQAFTMTYFDELYVPGYSRMRP